MRLSRWPTPVRAVLLALVLVLLRPAVASASWSRVTSAALPVASLTLATPVPVVAVNQTCSTLTLSWAAVPRANEYKATVKDLSGSSTYHSWASAFQSTLSYGLSSSSSPMFFPIGTTMTVTVQAFFYGPGQSAASPNWQSAVGTLTKTWTTLNTFC